MEIVEWRKPGVSNNRSETAYLYGWIDNPLVTKHWTRVFICEYCNDELPRIDQEAPCSKQECQALAIMSGKIWA